MLLLISTKMANKLRFLWPSISTRIVCFKRFAMSFVVGLGSCGLGLGLGCGNGLRLVDGRVEGGFV